MSFSKKEELVDRGYLSKSTFQNLILYNYTDKCTHEKYWIRETMESRGTIYDMNTGKVVARAFDKFFNLGEYTSTVDSLPALPFDVENKEDGSLGILYQFPGQDKWRVATRGSFYSEQAKRAEIILEKYDLSQWPEGWTPLVEIIYPENRIILNYGKEEKLVLLAARNIETGQYMSLRDLDTFAARAGMERPERSPKTVEELIEEAKTIPATHEGWVLTYRNGFKVKVKGARYLELARFKANLNPLTIWEVMMQGAPALDAFLSKIPEEFEVEANDMCQALIDQHNTLIRKANGRVAALGLKDEPAGDQWFKDKALLIQQEPWWMRGYLFQRMRRTNGADKAILALLRPKAGVMVDISKFD